MEMSQQQKTYTLKSKTVTEIKSHINIEYNDAAGSEYAKKIRERLWQAS